MLFENRLRLRARTARELPKVPRAECIRPQTTIGPNRIVRARLIRTEDGYLRGQTA